MTASDSSEDELHDIEWTGTDPDSFFEYNDPFALSPQISAVHDNDVKRLKLLLKSGKSVNINDNNGNTPIHVAVMKDKKKAFDFLIGLDEVRIDATNFDGVTPLMMALRCSNEYYALKLIRRGADVNIARHSGYTPLHYAVGNSVAVGQTLIEKGANINARSCLGETPLYLACERGDCDLIHLLLYYGADPTVPCEENILPFTLTMLKCPVEVQEILFEYTFDRDKVETRLYTIDVAMSSQSPLFYKIMEKTSEVLYDESDLKHLGDSLPGIKPNVFRAFTEQFEDVARDMFCVCNSLTDYIRFLGTFINEKPDFVEFFYMLCDSPLVKDAVQNYDPKVCLVHSLINRNLSLDTLTKLICSMLSCGVSIIANDLSMVYKYYGFCELFRIMLHMQIADYNCYMHDSNVEVFLMSMLIYDVTLDIDTFLGNPRQYISPNCYLQLCKFFSLSTLKKSLKLTEDKMKNSPQVPSLVELSRNVARQYIIDKYQIKNNVQFFTTLKWLPISQVYKAILSYEKEIYDV